LFIYWWYVSNPASVCVFFSPLPIVRRTGQNKGQTGDHDRDGSEGMILRIVGDLQLRTKNSGDTKDIAQTIAELVHGPLVRICRS